MLDVTDNELTVTLRVPEGRWLWLVSQMLWDGCLCASHPLLATQLGVSAPV